MTGIESLKEFIDQKVKEVNVVGAVEISKCDPVNVCSPEYYFDMVLMCRLCGRLC